MGKFNSKLLAMYITPTGVRVCEGENKTGNPDLSKFFTVSGVDAFFASAPGQAIEVVDMSGLVNTIVAECKNRHTTAKKIAVCSSCFGIQTEIKSEQGKGNLKEFLFGDLKDKKTKKTPVKSIPGQMVCKVDWGDIVEDGVVSHKSTVTTGDKFLLKSLVQAFYRQGYEIISISDLPGALLNFRQTEESTFDSKGKIIIDCDTEISVSSLMMDLPVVIDRYPAEGADTLVETLERLAKGAAINTGRHPKVFLSGDVFLNTELYGEVIDNMESRGMRVYDLFGRPEVNEEYLEKVEKGVLSPLLTPDYAACVALFLTAFNKQAVSLLPAVEFNDIFKKNSKAIATVVAGVAAVSFVVSGGLAGYRLVQSFQISNHPSTARDLEMRVSELNNEKSSLEETIQTLTQADVTVLDLMNFITAKQSDQVTIVSVDTKDMLHTEVAIDEMDVAVSTDDTAATPDDSGEVTGDSELDDEDATACKTREAILVRGYAKSGPAAVDYFDSLFHYGLSVDPVLNGVEKYVLPNGEQAYVFEIEIGGVNIDG